MRRGDVSRAIGGFSRVTRQQPQNVAAWFGLAQAYEKQGDPVSITRAIVSYEQVLKRSPKHVPSLKALANLLSWQDATRPRALTLLETAYQLSPKDITLQKKLVELNTWQGHEARAYALAKPISGQFSQDANWRAMLAHLTTRFGNPAEAVALYEAPPLNANQSKDFLLRAQYAEALYSAEKKPQDVSSIYQDLKTDLEKRPAQTDQLDRMALANLAYQLGHYQDALALDGKLPQAVRDANKIVQLRMGRSWVKTHQSLEGLAVFERLWTAKQLSSDETLEFVDYGLNQLKKSPDLALKTTLEAALTQLEQTPALPESELLAVTLRRARLESLSPQAFTKANTAYWQVLQALHGQPDLASTLDPQGLLTQEVADFLKANAKATPEAVLAQFDRWRGLDAKPNVLIEGAYAETLSWFPERRSEALKRQWALWQHDPAHRDLWQAALTDTLDWHTPDVTLVPTYEAMSDAIPGLWQAELSKARALRITQPEMSLVTYGALAQLHPERPEIQREWLDLLVSGVVSHQDALALLKPWVAEQPDNLEISLAYAQLLSYQHHYGEAIHRFEEVLLAQPDAQKAWIGLGYAQLWSGRPLAAKHTFSQAVETFPDAYDVLMGLAESEKALGRNDRALDRLQEIEQLKAAPSQSYKKPVSPNFQPVANWYPAVSSHHPIILDVSVLPPPVSGHAQLVMDDSTLSDTDRLQRDLDALDASLKALDALQQRADSSLEDMNTALNAVETLSPEARAVQAQVPVTQQAVTQQLESWNTQPFSNGAATPHSTFLQIPLMQGGDPSFSQSRYYGKDGLAPQDAPPDRLRAQISRDLRPTIRSGYFYTVQAGDPTTNRLRSYGFPNLASLYLTPQLQVRGGIMPRQLYLPRVDEIYPNQTTGTQYSLGGSWQPTDRLTLDGDLALTSFSQTQDENMTFQASASYKWSDRIRTRLGAWRLPIENSLLSFAGQRPTFGAFNDQTVGQAREQVLYGELTAMLAPRVDWTTQYQWGWFDVQKSPTNYKNQIFSTLGYTQPIGQNHSARLGYEFLWMNYAKNATFGYVDLVNGTSTPQITLDPPSATQGPAILGGYFSPSWFILNALRADIRGGFWHNRLEYRLGGSLGVQAFDNGSGFNQSSPTTLAVTADGMVTYHATDWLALYSNFAFIDTGGLYNRWLVGGGVIVRPNVAALSPVIK